MRPFRTAVLAALFLILTAPAFADATLFVGSATTPSNRTAKGFAVGAGLLVVAFEFEYNHASEDLTQGAPSLHTFMGDLILQTPFAIAGFQPYFETGGGAYRETLNTRQETNFGVNTGGGVKISLIGPVRARIDYRVFSLKGSPMYDVVHRVYAGVNFKF